jgi:hypothetical protein
MYSIDQGSDWGAGAAISSIARQGAQLKFVVDGVRGTYEGKFTNDSSSIEGTWTQRQPLPLVLRRATRHAGDRMERSCHARHSVRAGRQERQAGSSRLRWIRTAARFLGRHGQHGARLRQVRPKVTSTHHVYGITRRGFGDSSVPPDGTQPSVSAMTSCRSSTR